MTSPATAPPDIRQAEARLCLQRVRHWMTLHGHAARLPRLYEMLDGNSPARWREAAAHCVEIALAMDNPMPGEDAAAARHLRTRGTAECLRNATEAIARALRIARAA